MKVLIIPSWYPNSFNPLGGIFFKEQAESLQKYGHTVSVISINQYSIREIIKYKQIIFKNNSFTENGVKTYIIEYPAIPKLDFLRRKLGLLFFKKKFKKYIAENGFPDIIHLHSFFDGEFALWIKKNYNIPYIVTEHFSGIERGTVSKGNLKFAHNVFSNAAVNIAVSNKFKNFLEKKFNVPFSFIPNIVQSDFFLDRKKNNNCFFKFINIAFMDKNKNQAMLVKAFAKVFKNKKAILTIVGDGPEYQLLNNLIKKLEIHEQVFLYGIANRTEVKKLLQESDAFVLSSQYETFGIVVIEALACGLPVVSTKCGGPESIIQSKEVGILTDVNEVKLAEAMLTLYKNNKYYDSDYIAHYAKNNFSDGVICERLSSLYKKILNK